MVLLNFYGMGETPNGNPSVYSDATMTKNSDNAYDGMPGYSYSSPSNAVGTVAVGSVRIPMTGLGNIINWGTWSNQIHEVRPGGARIDLSLNTVNGSQVLGGQALSQGFHWVEVRCERTTSPVTYTTQVKVDGAIVVNSNTNIASLWTSGYAGFGVSGSSVTARLVGGLIAWDDLAGDKFHDWMGPMRFDVLRPNGNGYLSEWLGSDGNSVDNYQLIDETPPSTTDYVESSVDGQRDMYQFPNVAEAYKPLAFRGTTYGQKNGSNLRSYKHVIRQNDGSTSSEVVSSEFVLGAAPAFHKSNLITKNLITNADLTRADLAQFQFGVETSTPAP